MRVGVSTDVGRVRRSNEDAYWANPPWFAVADGMGGHVAGEVASQLAVNEVREVSLSEQDRPAREILATAIRQANAVIWKRGQEEVSLTGMGTTITVMRIDSDRCLVGHVGDSRCYQLRGTALRQITDDHSVVAELVRTGTLTENEAIGHPQRNLLTRALGAGPAVEPDIVEVDVLPGDKVMLCTDGLTAVLSPDEIRDTLVAKAEPEALAQRLVQKANERGGPDNITIVVVEVPAGQ